MDESDDAFPFFKLPRELRDTIYGHLTRRSRVQAIVKPSIDYPGADLTLANIWHPTLLLVSKQFHNEYFEEVCKRRVTCCVVVQHTRPAGFEQAPTNPDYLMRCLAYLSCFYIGSCITSAWSVDRYKTTLESCISALVASMPQLKSFNEFFYTGRRAYEIFVQLGQREALEILQGNYEGALDTVKRHTISGHKIQRGTELYVKGPLYCDLQTRKPCAEAGIKYYARRVRNEDEKPEHLWYGYRLETVSTGEFDVKGWLS